MLTQKGNELYVLSRLRRADGQTANAYCKRCGDWATGVKRKALFSAIALYTTYLGTDEAIWSNYLAGAFCLCIAGWQVSGMFHVDLEFK